MSTINPSNLLGLSMSLPMSRRDALRLSLFSTAGLLFTGRKVLGAEPGVGADASAGPSSAIVKVRAKSVIQIFLWGGMSHNDTWDPKPDSGYDYMGDLRQAIPTNVDGIQLGPLFPNLAKQAH